MSQLLRLKQTNGLLPQYFSISTDLNAYSTQDLAPRDPRTQRAATQNTGLRTLRSNDYFTDSNVSTGLATTLEVKTQPIPNGTQPGPRIIP
jgi:hypothetical protein